MSDWFSTLALIASRQVGKAYAFIAAVASIVVWAACGPIFGFSDTWQLIINTGTTVVTFLMVFLLQNSQTRDLAAIQIKLDELIRATADANNALRNAEDLSEADLAKIKTAH